jgi:glyoxylase-like metal-dependent hydrolase (beta-lactamase superfamily II)
MKLHYGTLLTSMTRLRNATLSVIDVAQFGEPNAGCAYLLSATKTALIDTGTAASAPRLLTALRGLRLDYVFITHIHLDHAGAAGHLALAHPEALFVVHSRGLPYLLDPTRLVAGVRAASPTLAPLYGEPLLIDGDRVVACADGESFPLGPDIALVAIETPGHAPHHVCFFEPTNGVLFAGDAVGHHSAPVDLPLTVPPRFDPAASRASIVRLLELHPRALAFTHFGITSDSPALLMVYPRHVDEWLARVDALRARLGPEEVPDAVLSEPRYALLSPVGREVVRLCVRGALLTLEARGPANTEVGPAGTARQEGGSV